MNALTIIGPTPAGRTMSSLEIAERTGKRHDHVMRDIKRMLEDLELAVPKFGGSYRGADNTERPLFNLPKDLTLTLCAGYSTVLRKRIVDRWLELEEAERPAVLTVEQQLAQAVLLSQSVLKLKDERIHLKYREFDHRSLQPVSTRTDYPGYKYPASGANFLGRVAVQKLLMASNKPKAKEFRDWLAGVSIQVEDTGGYLLNEAARDTAFADTRTTVPQPGPIAGGYAALIEARRGELEAKKGELAALIMASEEQAEREKIQVRLIESEACK